MNKSKKILIAGIVIALVVVAIVIGYNLVTGSGSVGQVGTNIISNCENSPKLFVA